MILLLACLLTSCFGILQVRGGDENTKAASLYYASGTHFLPVDDADSTGGSQAIRDYRVANADRRNEMAIITSEPLTDRASDWLPVPSNHTVIITSDMDILTAEVNMSQEIPVGCPHQIAVSHCLDALTACDTGSSHEKVGLLKQQLAQANEHADPDPLHLLTGHSDTVLTVVVSAHKLGDLLFSGGQDGFVRVWNVERWSCVSSVKAHDGSVLKLEITQSSSNVTKLYSSGSDSLIKVWLVDHSSMQPLQCLAILRYDGMGQVMSLVVDSPDDRGVSGGSAVKDRVFCGLQACQVLAHDLPTEQLGVSTPSASAMEWMTCAQEPHHAVCSFREGHCSFVLSLTICGNYLCSGAGDSVIKIWALEGIQKDSPAATNTQIATLRGHHGAVMCLVAAPGAGTLYSGCRDNTIKVWDMENKSFACRRTLQCSGEVLSLCLTKLCLISGDSGGEILAWGRGEYELVQVICTNSSMITRSVSGKESPLEAESDSSDLSWGGVHTLAFIASEKDNGESHEIIFAGFSDACIRAWDLKQPEKDGAHEAKSDGAKHRGTKRKASESVHSTVSVDVAAIGSELATNRSSSQLSMETMLRQFVAYRSVSRDESMREECWRCAKFLATLLETQCGASVRIAPGADGKNPVVLGRVGRGAGYPTVVVYGHYDVVPVGNRAEWQTDPWKLTGINGYLYGRGSTDDKGPIIATIFALMEWLKEGDELSDKLNIAFVYEGEEESSSAGFRDVISQYRDWICEDTEVLGVLVSNNYWVGEDQPCLTYGLRGIIDTEISVSGPARDLHSGIDGGTIVEPLMDLLGVVGSLVDSRGMIHIPGFYKDASPLAEDEKSCIDAIKFNVEDYRKNLGVKSLVGTSGREILESRWRQPSLSVTDVRLSAHENKATDGCGCDPLVARTQAATKAGASSHSTVISKYAVANISVRFVPEQTAEQLVACLEAHLRHEFSKRHSPNILTIKTLKIGDWWLGDCNSQLFQEASAGKCHPLNHNPDPNPGPNHDPNSYQRSLGCCSFVCSGGRHKPADSFYGRSFQGTGHPYSIGTVQ